MRKNYLHRFCFDGKRLQLEYFCLTESIIVSLVGATIDVTLSPNHFVVNCDQTLSPAQLVQLLMLVCVCRLESTLFLHDPAFLYLFSIDLVL